MFNALEPWHLLIIVGVVVVLFGAKRLPDSARSIGRSLRIFRSEIHDAAKPAVTEAAPPPIPPAPVSTPTESRSTADGR